MFTEQSFTTGFMDLANLSQATDRHSKSKRHIDCAVKLKLFGRTRIDEVQTWQGALKEHNEREKKNQDVLMRLIVAALY